MAEPSNEDGMTLATMLVAFCLAKPAAPQPPVPGYSLVWSDEFNGTTIDPSKWKPWAVGKRRDAMNSSDAATLDGKGRLWITTRRVPLPDGSSQVTSGGIWTSGLFEPMFGYYEARIKMVTQEGHWGAFWLNSNRMGVVPGDPKTGVEMDIVEFHKKLKGGTEVVQTLHWDGYGKDHKSKSVGHATSRPDREFHDYGMLWEPTGYRFYVDRQETWRTESPGNIPVSLCREHLILSVEVGAWGGKISDARLPDSMIVDWVRVWQRRR